MSKRIKKASATQAARCAQTKRNGCASHLLCLGDALQTLFDHGRVFQETDACETLALPSDLAWKAAEAIDR